MLAVLYNLNSRHYSRPRSRYAYKQWYSLYTPLPPLFTHHVWLFSPPPPLFAHVRGAPLSYQLCCRLPVLQQLPEHLRWRSPADLPNLLQLRAPHPRLPPYPVLILVAASELHNPARRRRRAYPIEMPEVLRQAMIVRRRQNMSRLPPVAISPEEVVQEVLLAVQESPPPRRNKHPLVQRLVRHHDKNRASTVVAHSREFINRRRR